jgi:pimeloyl-ACP methyl ester carboxylesterase
MRILYFQYLYVGQEMHIHVERHGMGKSIVFVHGASGSSLSWYFQKEHLKRLMEVVLIDLPGHGQSPGEGLGRIEDARDVLHGAIKTLDLERFFLVGHSMGGAIAMLFALTYPELLEGLILVSTGAKLRVLPEILGGILKDKEATVRRITQLAFSPKAHPAIIENGFNLMMKCKGEVIYSDFSSCEQFSLMDRVKKIHTPTLILCGEDDLLTPPKFSEYLKAEIPDSRLVRIPDAGHIVMVEKPEPVNRAIETFVLESQRA